MINLHSISYLNRGNTWLYGCFCVVFDCFTWNKNSLKQLQSLNKMCFSFEVCFGDSHWKLWLALWVLYFLFSDLSFMDLEKNSEIGTGVQETLKKIRMHWETLSKEETAIIFINSRDSGKLFASSHVFAIVSFGWIYCFYCVSHWWHSGQTYKAVKSRPMPVAKIYS